MAGEFFRRLGLHFGWLPTPELSEIKIDNAPGFMRGLRALFVSDVHLRKAASERQLAALMALMATQKADLILLGGDYAEAPAQGLRFFEALSGIDAPLGIYAVMGNNDRECFPEIEKLRKMMADGGVKLLCNECAAAEIGGGRLLIGGCDDHKHGSPRTRDLFAGAADYRILISHFPVLPDCACELMLSGHTHGGQLCLGRLSPYSIGYERRYGMLALQGLHRTENRLLLVSRGIGVSRLPLRAGAAPQMHLLKFTG